MTTLAGLLAVTLAAAPPPLAQGRDASAGQNDAPAKQDRGLAEKELAHGQLALDRKHYKKALAHFNRALRHGADAAVTKGWRGLAHLWLEHYRKAESDLMAAAGAWSDADGLRKALGQAQMAQGKFMWAMRQFKAVLESRPGDIGVRINLAYCLMRMEAYEDALKLLKKAAAKAENARLKKRATMLLGLCHYRKNELARARTLLLGLKGGHWGRGARRVLGLILEREAGIETGWSAYLSLGAGVDSNPVMGDEPVPGWSRAGDAALDLSLNARFSWTPLVRGPHSLAGRIGVRRHFYVAPWDLEDSHERVSAFSMTTAEGGGDYRYAYLTPKGPRSLRLGYAYQVVQLDGGKGLPGEADPFLFSETHGLALAWQLQNHPDRIQEYMVEPSYSAFRDRDRDGAAVKATTRWSLFFMNHKFKLFPECHVGYRHARFTGWRYLTAGLWLGVSYLGPWQLDLSGSVSQEAHVHPQSKGAFETEGPNAWQLPNDEYRHDHVTSLALGVGRALDKRRIWRLDLSMRYMRSWSTADFFKYSRVTALLAVTATLDHKTFEGKK